MQALMVESGKDADNCHYSDPCVGNSSSGGLDLGRIKRFDFSSIYFQTAIKIESWPFDYTPQRIRKV